jgi:hypothetical protein
MLLDPFLACSSWNAFFESLIDFQVTYNCLKEHLMRKFMFSPLNMTSEGHVYLLEKEKGKNYIYTMTNVTNW